MLVISIVVVLTASYLVGAIPFGYIITKMVTGKDVRQHESGRTGTTNTMRVAGVKAGFATVLLDAFKGILAVWMARYFVPESLWLQILAPLAATIGHNYSIFMTKKDEHGRIHLGGGAGGATGVGGAIGLWWPSFFIIVPVSVLCWFGVGYASLATLSVGLVSILVFTYRAAFENGAWVYVFYGVLLEIIVIWALRPNIKRLMDGTERLVGWRARQNRAQ